MTEKFKCPISGKLMNPAFTETILNKYNVTYYYSDESGLLKTEKPYWLSEAYAQPINETDTGLVQRNIFHCELLEVIIEALSMRNGKFLDVAGGYGLLTRLMRDKGFDCYSKDKYCQNLFAKAFEPASEEDRFDAIFAFEVLEHIENPLEFLATLFNQYGCRTAIFSTVTFKMKIPSRDWWYYSFETGQHITFYQTRTLEMLANRLKCKYYKINSGFHIITDIDLTPIKKAVLLNRAIRKLFSFYVKNKRIRSSKTWEDYLKIKKLVEEKSEKSKMAEER